MHFASVQHLDFLKMGHEVQGIACCRRCTHREGSNPGVRPTPWKELLMVNS